MQESKQNLAERFLGRLAEAIYHRPRWFFYPCLLLLVASVFVTVRYWRVSTSRNDLVDANAKYHQNFLKFRNEFPSMDDLVAVVESGDVLKNRQFVERLAAKLTARPDLFTNVFYKGDYTMLGKKALLFAPEDDLATMRDLLGDYRPLIQQFGQATNLNSLFTLVNDRFLEAGSAQREGEPAPETDSLIEALPALERIVSEARDSMERPGTPPSPGVTALFGLGAEAEEKIYITFDNGRTYLVTAHAVSRDLESDAVDAMRRLMAETQGEVPGVNVGLTGEPVLEFDEMKQAQSDTMRAAVVALAIVAIIFVYAYRETGRPLKATLCLLVGLGYTMAFTMLTVGSLNILTITFVPIQIGLAIDFGVHLITRYEEELRLGASELESLRRSMTHTGVGILTSGLTTAGAFLAMGFTGFKGVREMGIISGGGLILSLIPMMIMLPVLLLRGKQNVLDHSAPAEADSRGKIEQLWLDRPRWVVAIGLGLTALSLTQFPKVYFDYNLLHLQTEGLPAVEYEMKLMNDSSKSVLFGAVVADSLEEAVELEKRLSQLPTVASVDSMGKYLTEDQDRKLKLVGEIKGILEPLYFPPVDLKPVSLADLSRTLYSLSGFLGGAKNAIREKGGEEALLAGVTSLDLAVRDFRVAINQEKDRGERAEKLAAFQQALFLDLRETLEAIRNQDNSQRLTVADLPPTLHDRFVGVTGKHLLQVYPKEDVWDREFQERFVRELRTVDASATGTPIQLYEYTTLLKNSFVEAAWYSLIAIAILVFIHFRRVSCVILALLPVSLGACWTAGIMGLVDIPFNPANIMTLPLVIGIGVTSGIHILNRFSEDENPGILGKSTGKAVLVSALTTMAGFGSLMMAKHQGIESLGYVMSIGTAACMLAALTFLTALLTLLTGSGWNIRKTQ